MRVKTEEINSLDEIIRARMSVDHGGAERSMSQEGLYYTNINTIAEPPGGRRMTDKVRVNRETEELLGA